MKVGSFSRKQEPTEVQVTGRKEDFSWFVEAGVDGNALTGKLVPW
jgi:hypothetical protein